MCRKLLTALLTTALLPAAFAWAQPADTAEKDSALKAPTVKLLEPGRNPRQPLRYGLQKGQQQTAVMVTEMAMDQSFNGNKNPAQPLPNQHMTLSASVQDVTAEGNYQLATKLEKVEVSGDNVAQAVKDAVSAQVGMLTGVVETATITPRGLAMKRDLQMPEGADESIKKQLSSLNQSLAQTTMAFPEEAIGVGGKWSVTTPFQTEMFDFEQVATYTLTERTADGAKVSVSIVQSAPAQDVQVPGTPQKLRLEKFSSTGQGEIAIRTDQPFSASDLKLTTTNVVSAKDPIAIEVVTEMTMKFSIKPQ